MLSPCLLAVYMSYERILDYRMTNDHSRSQSMTKNVHELCMDA